MRVAEGKGDGSKLGPATDPLAVVDASLNVYGLLGQRVADASIMPNLGGGNASAPSTMIGERAAQFILDLHPESLSEAVQSFPVPPAHGNCARAATPTDRITPTTMQALAPTAARAIVVRPAATTLVLRDSAHGPEVLMVKRSPNASFMPGAYVFPGGAVDAADADADADADMSRAETAAALAERIGRVTGVGALGLAYAVAALRECKEECGLDLGSTAALQPWSHWVTPLGLPKRFDTLFFVCRAPVGQVARPDHSETTTLEWVVPGHALQAQAAGHFQMEFATVSTVRSLLPFAGRDVQAILDHAAAQAHLPALHPRVKVDETGRVVSVVLPGQPGYAELVGDGA
jgi:8-oxo-dGTP pyrophosphatase MutT (NUDIX family)